MAKRERNSSGRVSHAARMPDVLGCFDADLRVCRHLFDDAVGVYDIAVDTPPVVPAGRPETLRFGELAVDLSVLFGWLAPLAERGGWAYYLHHHDNIVVEVARVEPYARAAFRRFLRLFRTCPADEGGTNLLGVVGPGRAWVLVAENDNQGRFRIDFFGSGEVCQDLRTRLSPQRHAEPCAAPDTGRM